jgi:hypothetical protein
MFRAWKFWQGEEPEPWLPTPAEDTTKAALLEASGHGKDNNGQ